MLRAVLVAACLCLLWPTALAGSDTPDAPTLILAHRGQSGYLPEHTLAAYAYAYAAGADMIEPDVVLTKDGVAICSHDLTLEKTTDAERVFPDRARDDGKWYAIDFTIEEVRQLRRHGPGGATPDGFGVATLVETVAMVQALNERSGRTVGIIPEPKAPAFHAAAGVSVEDAVLDVLADFGLDETEDPAIIQCFDLEALRGLHDRGAEVRLVYLTGEEPPSESVLDDVAEFCVGLGPSKRAIERDGELYRDGWLLKQCRARGLEVYPYTFRSDREEIGRFVRTYGVDGIFCDFTDIAVEV
ncbi:MAG: glycerophosphodiester phosphodiesterase family protein, partial [Planctomycetota bacterium]